MMDTCGAKTRSGAPCKQKSIYWNGRCKFHGGLATGPKTEAGKEQCRINGRKGGRPRKDSLEVTEIVEHQGKTNGSEIKIQSMVSELHAPDVQPFVTEVMVHNGNGNPKITLSFPAHEMSKDVQFLATPEQRESPPEKPKSCMLKDANNLLMCSRCEMLASNGACLAVAKGVIPSMPTGESCTAFSAF